MTSVRLRERAATTGLLIIGLLVLLCALRIDRDWFEVHVLRLRCAVDERDLLVIERIRWLTALVGVATIAAARPLGRRLGRAGAVPGTWGRIAAAVVLAILTSGVVLRARSHVRAAPVALPPVREDARLGWTYQAPQTTVLVDDGRPIAYAIDADGDRVEVESDRPDVDRPTILFAGESVTFGLGVTWSESYPTMVGRRLGVQSINAGVHGYGDNQIRLHTLDRLAQLRRPLAVVTLVLADLIERDVDVRRERLLVADDGALIPAHADNSFFRRSELVAMVERLGPWQSTGSIRTARAVYAATARDVRASGAYPLFVLTNYHRPCLPDASGRPSIEGRLFDALDLPHIRVDLDPSFIIRSNEHPDARAHAQLADAIASALVDAHVVAPEAREHRGGLTPSDPAATAAASPP